MSGALVQGLDKVTRQSQNCFAVFGLHPNLVLEGKCGIIHHQMHSSVHPSKTQAVVDSFLDKTLNERKEHSLVTFWITLLELFTVIHLKPLSTQNEAKVASTYVNNFITF